MNVILLLIVIAAVAALVEWLSLKNPEERLDVRSAFDRHLAEIGEEITMQVVVENRKRLPVFYVEIEQTMSKNIRPVSEHKDFLVYRDYTILRDYLYLKGRERVTRGYAMKGECRGPIRLGASTLVVGDFLGIKTNYTKKQNYGEVVIVPRKLDEDWISKLMGGFLGEISVRRFIMEDPILITGFADYTGREPMKAISWNQSAKAGRMVVKQYDHTTECSVAVVMFVRPADEIERMYSVARTVCEQLTDRTMSWAFYTNANMFHTSGRWKELPFGTGRMHLELLMEGLGRSDGSLNSSAEELLLDLLGAERQATGYLLLMGEETPEGKAFAAQLEARTGQTVRVLYTEGGADDGITAAS